MTREEFEFNHEKIKEAQEKLLNWYDSFGRDFPWRSGGLSSYELIIVEVLLQRTKADTVSNYFGEFIERFNSWEDLDNADRKELEKVLKPVGLYRQKAKRLKSLANEMVKNNGKLPNDRDALENIPLIGQYIASAIISYVHDEPAPLLDVNMARFLERYFGPRSLADIRYDPYLQKISSIMIDHSKHRECKSNSV